MDPRFFRKYADLITEAEQSPVQLDEGIIDSAKQYANKLLKVLDPTTLKQIATTVKQATGGDYSLTKDNALKAAKALGISDQTSVAEGIAPTLGGKIWQALHLGAIGAGATMGADPFSGDIPGVAAMILGFIALLATSAIWGDAPGQLGHRPKA